MYYDWVIATLFSMVYPYWSEGMASTPWSPPVLTVQLAQSLKRRPSQFHSDLVKDKHKRSTDYACWRRTSPGGEAWCYCCRTSRWACTAKRHGVENLWSGFFFHTRFIQFCVFRYPSFSFHSLSCSGLPSGCLYTTCTFDKPVFLKKQSLLEFICKIMRCYPCALGVAYILKYTFFWLTSTTL